MLASFCLSNIYGFQSPPHPHTGLTIQSVQIVFNRGNNSEALSQRPPQAWISAAHTGHLTNPISSMASFLSLCPSLHPYQHFLGLTPKYLLKMLLSGSAPGKTQPKTETKSLNDSRSAQEHSGIKWEIELLRCGRGLYFKIYIVLSDFSVIVCGIWSASSRGPHGSKGSLRFKYIDLDSKTNSHVIRPDYVSSE